MNWKIQIKKTPLQGLCKGVLVSAIEILDLLRPGRVTELADGFVFDLADAFTGNAEDLADLLEGMRPTRCSPKR